MNGLVVDSALGAGKRHDVSIVTELPDSSWRDDHGGPTRGVEALVEGGRVLHFPDLAFELSTAEMRFLDPRWADASAKNISLRWPVGELRGAVGAPVELRELTALVVRYADAAEALALRLFPHYRGHLRRGNTSLRPIDVAGRAASWRQDDTRLHVDAFPSNPTHGTRLLRVFCNVNPHGEPRRWRVGEPFEDHARRYLARLKPQPPLKAWLLAAAGITKRRRSGYDDAMLQLHDLAKADAAFQRESPQTEVAFAPGTTWVVYSDQVLHAAMGGQHLLEQTFQIEPEHLHRPDTAPLHVLERLLRRPLR